MSAFQNDDTYNVLAEHWIEAFQADTKLGTGGDLEIVTWEDTAREDASEYNDNELPAASIVVSNGGNEDVDLSKWHRSTYLGVFIIYTTGGRLDVIDELARRYGARFERVIRQQGLQSKQISNVTDALDGAEQYSVKITGLGTSSGAGEVKNTLRGVFSIAVRFTIDFETPSD